MRKLIACIIAYNEEQLLPGCLDSIKDKVDEIVLVEGRIQTYPGANITSTDKTLQIANEYDCVIITSPGRAWENEQEMRSQYLIGNEGDWYIQIDADERCMTPLPNINDLPNDIQAWSILVKMVGDSTGKYRPRLFKHHGHMEYKYVHDALFSNGKLISNPINVPRLYSVWFAHLQMQRNSKRRMEKRQYYDNGYVDEPQHRKRLEMVDNGTY